MEKPCVIGVDLGGTNLRVAVVDASGRLLRRHQEPSEGDVLEALRRAVGELMGPEVAAVGLGVAGVLDRQAQVMLSSPNLPQLNGRSLALEFGVPLVVENDANAAALGEALWGAGRAYQRFVLLTLGTGVGGGVVYDGRLMEVSAELGHITVQAQGGRSCPCGNTGCLESYAGARAIVDAVHKALQEGQDSALAECCQGNIYRITPEDIYKAAFEGDNLARETLREAGRYLGAGIASLINIFSPQAVILGGGLTGAWNIYVQEAIREASRRAFRSLFAQCQIVPAALGPDAGLLGAAALALKKIR
jgi:glucokinase